MLISVIIPVYNAEKYVRQAVESALDQPETAEVILVEDGSPDDSLAVCQELAAECTKVHLYRHPDGRNHGEAASRNLAIRKSTCEYIVCLDADDFFLPGRFSVARELLEADPQLDGVYEALGEHIESEAALQRWSAIGRPRGLTTMTIRVPPEQLFDALVSGKHGWFCLEATVLRRVAFDKAGLFDEHLRLAPDTAMCWKLAAVARLAPGRLDEPVAVRRIHEHNVSSDPQLRSPRYKYRVWMKMLSCVWRWCRKNDVDREKREVLLHRFLSYAEYSRLNKSWPKWTHRFQRRCWLILTLFRYPLLVREPSLWERLIPDRVAMLYGHLTKA